jgi:precorrin-8X/cobalt-precorrin-8 methylmutase
MGTTVTRNYQTDGAAIYRQSFTIIRSEADLSAFPPAFERVVVRMIHACGMTDLPAYVSATPGFAEIGIQALRNGAPILCDSRMVADGITRSRLKANNEIVCTLEHPETPEIARRLQTTRSAAALELWRDRLGGSVVAIGNAPTALFHLIEMLEQGAPKPALVVGIPVGFVGAAESKAALQQQGDALPHITVVGRRGGSAIAAAAINALASEEE